MALLALLAAHAFARPFACDDEYIAFRFAANLADGSGFVFNPGERAEGVVHPLWTALLALAARLGLAPEHSGPLLNALASAGIWALLLAYALRWSPLRGAQLAALVPLAALALCRSFAQYSVYGLETRLFEMLILAAALRALLEIEDLAPDAPQRRPLAGALFALAELVRPEALLLGGCALACASARELLGRRRSARIASWWLGLLLPVGLHFLLRRAYFGEWLPIPYYAKVDGRTWWHEGSIYLRSFALEYALWAWLPLIAAACVAHARARTLHVPALLFAMALPYALYVASVGGDHFEWRPADLLFPLFAPLLYDGARELWSWRRWRVASATYALCALALLVDLPFATAQRTQQLIDRWAGRANDEQLVAKPIASMPACAWLHRVPGLDRLAQLHIEGVDHLRRSMGAVRREEQARFLHVAEQDAADLEHAIESGELPRDLYVAMGPVGAIPYRTHWKVFDVFGLTDPAIGKLPFARPNLRAHGKLASVASMRARGAELLLLSVWQRASEPPPDVASMRSLDGAPLIGIELEHGVWLAGYALQGLDQLRARLPLVRVSDLSRLDSMAALLANY